MLVFKHTITRRGQIKYENLSEKQMQKSIRLGKYLEYGSSLEAYLWIDNMTLDDNLSLNLYIVPITCYVIIILDGQEEVRSEFLVREVLENSQLILVGGVKE